MRCSFVMNDLFCSECSFSEDPFLFGAERQGQGMAGPCSMAPCRAMYAEFVSIASFEARAGAMENVPNVTMLV